MSTAEIEQVEFLAYQDRSGVIAVSYEPCGGICHTKRFPQCCDLDAEKRRWFPISRYIGGGETIHQNTATIAKERRIYEGGGGGGASVGGAACCA